MKCKLKLLEENIRIYLLPKDFFKKLFKKKKKLAIKKILMGQTKIFSSLRFSIKNKIKIIQKMGNNTT